MSKIANDIKKYGIVDVIVIILKKIFYKIFYFFDKLDNKIRKKRNAMINKKYYIELEKIISNPKYKYVFLFYPYTEWQLPVFQRPQQIALSLSKRDDVLYLYGSANYTYDNITNLFEKINDNLYVINDYNFVINLPIKNRIIHLYSTDVVSRYSEVANALAKGDKVLYEYIDEINESITLSAPTEYLEKHKKILRNEKVYVIATADKLYNDVKKVRSKNFALSTNGVNINDFVYDDNIKIEKMESIKKQYKKIICYYGSLAIWFDYQLLLKCALKYPNYAFVLIGMKYDDSFEKSKILKQKNIIYLGKVPYKELINYTKYADLFTIPFKINEITQSTSPVKLFEYMATSKPILTTAMNECKKYKSVIIGKDEDDFINKIDSTIALINDEKYLSIELKEAKANTWDSKAKVIMDLLNNREVKRGKNEKK
jgi:teichuronic acid biosynthesis glycosyltransferase TuaH